MANQLFVPFGFSLTNAMASQPAQSQTAIGIAASDPAKDPTTPEAWFAFLLKSDAAVDAVAKLAKDAGKEARNRKTRFAIWATKHVGKADWWNHAAGKKLLAGYIAAYKADCTARKVQCADTQEKQRMEDAAVTYYNACERKRAEEEGRDAVLFQTHKERKDAKKGPVRLTRERIAALYIQLAKDENAPKEVQEIVQALRELATPPVILALENASKKKGKKDDKKTTKKDDAEPALM